MPLTKEEKARKRAEAALDNGQVFHARGDANRNALEEMRAEIAAGRKSLQNAASAGKKRMETAAEDCINRIQQTGEEEVQKVKRAKKEKAEETLHATEEDAAPLSDSAAPAAPPARRSRRPRVMEMSDSAARDENTATSLSGLTTQATARDESPTFADQLAVVQDFIVDPTARLYVTEKLSAEHRKLLALGGSHSIIQLQQNAKTLQLEYKQARISAREGIFRLQQLSVEVQRQSRAADKDRVGTAYHKGYQAAVAAFMKLSWELRHHEFICQCWIQECHMRAGLEQFQSMSSRPLSRAIAGDVMMAGSLSWKDIEGANLLK